MPESAAATPGVGGLFTIKSILVPLLRRPRIAHLIKWIVYGSLLINFAIYLYDDWVALYRSLPDDAPLSDVFERFATSIDTVAWLGLVFVFELETYVLPDEAFKRWVVKTLHAARVVCYVGIVYAAWGYTAEALENYDTQPLADLPDLCQIADAGRHIQIDAIEYIEITSENCNTISSGAPFYQIANEISVIDAPTLTHVQWMGWVDIANAYVWLLVVALIEVEIWLQNKDRFSSRALQPVRQIKTLAYAVLIVNAVIWWLTGYPIYGWDAFLWIFGFWAIELNLAEWELDRVKQLRANAVQSTTSNST